MTSSNNNAGVYMLRHPHTGDAYIGASCNLEQRLRSWVSTLTKPRRHGCYTPRLGGAFEDIDIEDVEMRVLEYVDVPESQKCKLFSYANATPAVRHLLDRERYWIETLKPSLNVKANRRINLDALPMGAP